MSAEDAYVRKSGATWTLGTAAVQKTVALDHGRFLLKSWRDPASGRELMPPGAECSEFFATVDDVEIGGASGGWALVGSRASTRHQGERQLAITLRRGPLEVTKRYLLHPGSSVVSEWVTFRNAGEAPLALAEPGFLDLVAQPDRAESLDFHWMTGGGNHEGCWTLKTETLTPGTPRRFDSYDPFPAPEDKPKFPGDGVNARIALNGGVAWGEVYVANATVTVPFDFSVDVRAGDRLAFLVEMRGNIGFDTTAFDPTLTYQDGERHTASEEFGQEQGEQGWRYQYLENGKYVDLVYYPQHRQWRKAKDNETGTPFIGPGNQHPGDHQEAARVWVAPRAGRVRITGSVCNTGNLSDAIGPGFKPGTTSYAPWYALFGRDSRQGVVIGWDYFGHWASAFAAGQAGGVAARLKVAGHHQTLQPGESVTTPRAFTALFRDDLDNAGNELLDWQYAYLWDYVREGWFPAIRMLGYWWRGTSWGSAAWTGGNPDWESTVRKVFRIADFMRTVGGDVYHRDWGWWDRAGDWNGPDWRAANAYLRKHGMGLLIYAFVYTVDSASRVARQHPDWVEGNTLDLSRPEVVAFLGRQLDSFVRKWGDFEWRNDSFFTAPRGGDDTPLLGQDQGFRRLVKGWLDRHPDCAFQAVNGGGNYAGYDYIRYSSCIQMTDGAAGLLSNYYTSLLFPPDKTCHMPDVWDPAKFDPATWHGLLCLNFDMSGETTDPVRLDGLRRLIAIYHYLLAHGVVGRWSRVYRPVVEGDDPRMYFQRMRRDQKHGIVITKHAAPGAVTIWLKGLLPAETYRLDCSESGRQETRSGADLMQQGVHFDRLAPGELIFINLPLYPGSRLDRRPPTAPRAVVKRRVENLGFPGVEIAWERGRDDNWLNHYEVFRNGALIDRVAKGTFCFDHSAAADLAGRYEVRAVDGAGNTSALARARGGRAPAARVLDDAPGGGIALTGPWVSRTGIPGAHAGTISVATQAPATARVTFEGSRVLWFGWLGPECGKAAVSVDGGPSELVDTYCADDLGDVCVYQRALPAGRHALQLTVLGERSPRSGGAAVYLDAIRIER